MITIYCPIKNDRINGVDCNIICDVVDGFFSSNVLPKNIVFDENHKKICLNCKYHNAVEKASLDNGEKIVFFRKNNGKIMASLDVEPEHWEFFELDEDRIKK